MYAGSIGILYDYITVAIADPLNPIQAIEILNNFKNEEVIAGYITDLESIKSIYNDVKITYEVGEPQTIEKDGMLMVVQSESSHVSMSDETLQKIIEVTEQIRNMYMNIKA